MSLLKQTQSLRCDEQALVRGYISESYPYHIPDTVQRVCMLFCFVMDEFLEVTDKDTSISDFNNTVVTVSLSKEETETAGILSIGRNTIKTNTGKYHWKLRILSLESQPGNGVRIGWIDSKCERIISYLVEPHEITSGLDAVDLYFDSDAMTVCFLPEWNTDIEHVNIENDKSDYRMGIHFQGSGSIQLVEYHQSNWYHHSCESSSSSSSIMGLARCESDHQQRALLISKALHHHPHIEEWNDLYLLSLNAAKNFDIGYEHAMTFKMGYRGIYQLAMSLRDEGDHQRAVDLFGLLTRDEIDKMDGNLHFGNSLRTIGRHKEAIPFMERHLELMEQSALSSVNLVNGDEVSPIDSNNNGSNGTIPNLMEQFMTIHVRVQMRSVINRLAWTYYMAIDYKKALSTFQRLSEEQIVQFGSEAAFAHCLQLDGSDKLKALKYYQKYLERNPQDSWTFARLAEVYGHLQEHDSFESEQKQKECLLKAVEYSTGSGPALCAQNKWYLAQYMEDVEGDTLRANEIYHEALKLAPTDHKALVSTISCSLSINYHVLERWDEAITYALIALENAPGSPTLIANVAEFYFHAKQLRNSYEMFQKSLTFDPFGALQNGYFGLVLYEWNRIDEALIYFERFETVKNEVSGAANRGMKTKCAVAMANIYHRKGNFEMSIVKGMEALNDKEDIQGFKKVDEIHYLLARNHCKMQEFDAALKHLNTAREIHADPKYERQIAIIESMKEPAIDF